MGPKVSIVLPTYNQARYLPRALDSIFAQTFRDFELIVVNDGSTDETASILASYQQMHDFALIEQENKGLPTALNVGFAQARGEYLTWTSSDNVMMPEMLEVLVQALDENPGVGLVYADWYVVDEQDQVLAIARTIDYDRFLLLRDNYINACFLYRRECAEKVGLYDVDFMYCEDWDYWLRMARFYKMMHIDQILYQYRIHEDSLTSALANRPESSERYGRFAKYWRGENPIAWYYSKLKWHLLKRCLGHAPTVTYQPVH